MGVDQELPFDPGHPEKTGLGGPDEVVVDGEPGPDPSGAEPEERMSGVRQPRPQGCVEVDGPTLVAQGEEPPREVRKHDGGSHPGSRGNRHDAHRNPSSRAAQAVPHGPGERCRRQERDRKTRAGERQDEQRHGNGRRHEQMPSRAAEVMAKQPCCGDDERHRQHGGSAESGAEAVEAAGIGQSPQQRHRGHGDKTEGQGNRPAVEACARHVRDNKPGKGRGDCGLRERNPGHPAGEAHPDHLSVAQVEAAGHPNGADRSPEKKRSERHDDEAAGTPQPASPRRPGQQQGQQQRHGRSPQQPGGQADGLVDDHLLPVEQAAHHDDEHRRPRKEHDEPGHGVSFREG